MANCGMWFGTEQFMQWIETPLSGATSNPESWRTGATYLNGGGFVTHAWNSHKTYDYSWRNSSARQAAQTMKSYRDGTYGRGLIYFVDPLTYDTNVLPARWADPSMALEYEGPSHVSGEDPVLVPATGFQRNHYPVQQVRYDLTRVPSGFREEDSVFIPVPEDHGILFGAVYSSTGSGGVFVAPTFSGGVVGAPFQLPPQDPAAENVMSPIPAYVGGLVSGVRLYFGKSDEGVASVTVGALSARIVTPGEMSAPALLTQRLRGPWVGGQGHSGCRFDGEPTYIEYNGVNGGQVGYSARFREVGSWA